MKLAYRPDIDGLRAIAVLLVIGYHAGFSTLSGGFIGVDIFFVISGFLITSIVYTEVSTGSFSFKTFYRKRMKRILPPFYSVCLATLIAGLIVFTPQDLLDLGKHLKYAASFISNIYLLKNAGYFSPESESLPLLHTWSLAIEEQFYLLWPVFLLLIHKKLKRLNLVIVASILSILSLAYSQYLLAQNQNEAYYQIQSRAWELLLGAALAIAITQGLHQKMTHLKVESFLSSIGLGLLLIPALLYSEDSPFPGLYAFIPCLGAALLILSGSIGGSFINRSLSNKALVYIGLLSYSLYLWHWPIFAFTRYLVGEFTFYHATFCILATIAISLISYYWVEKPLRFNQLKSFKWVLLLYLLIPICTFVAISKLIKSNDGFPERFDNHVIQQTNIVFSEFKKPINEKLNLPEFIDKVAIGKTAETLSQIDAILWGDSHAMHMYGLFDEIGNTLDLSFVASSDGACAPLVDTIQLRYGRIRDKGCKERNQATLDFILNSDIQYVVLSARWSLHYETTRYVGESGASVYLGDQESTEQSIENTQRVFNQSLEALINKLQENNKTVILISQVPSHKKNAANCLIKQTQYPSLNSGSCSIDYQEVVERQSGYRKAFTKLKEKYSYLKILDFNELICDQEKCQSELDGIPLYKDQDHLNPIGASTIANKWMSKNAKNIFNK